MGFSLRRTVPLALVVAVLLPVAPVHAEGRREVTVAEYRKIKVGMTRERVERIFGAGRGCEYEAYDLYGIHFSDRQYRNARGGWTAIQYNTAQDGTLRTRVDEYGFKQYDTVKGC